ncbi:heat shock protein HslJ [Dysgonomonas sp. PH5-45]|uniref:META domain-containing protein n=1 Tax=unclassified Dysgonomonas TaxID=2630389 RepID=UPI0024758360|nr:MULTISPECIES: META domain-containing protein [unclassified Dysgonomonas]MDH6355981.1 heat shock protein HslJ [Dysgonomonas sp. PH5-45]MDH6388874.1 heat shock protein HslJ [Dysgonomonas sp. PH5-37]
MKTLKQIMLLSALMLLTGLTMQSCKSSGNTVKSDNDISGTWVLTNFKGQVASEYFTDKVPYLKFDTAEKRLSGNGGCNTIGGPFTFEKGVLKAGNLISTMMMCPGQNKESEFTAILSKPLTVAIANNEMTLSDNGTVIATFARSIDQGLLQNKWTLESLGSQDIKKLFPSGRMPYVEFFPNRMSGNAGCNTFSGDFGISGYTLSMGPIMATRRGCADLAGESKFMEAVGGVSTLSVTENTLTFLKDGKVVAKFVR